MGFIVSGALIIAFCWQGYRFARLYWRGIRTTGTITELIKDDSSEGASIFTPVVSFTTNQGVRVVGKSSFETPEAGTYFRVGEKVDVLYLADNPQSFAIAGYEVSMLLFLGLLVIGALVFCYYHGGW